MALLLVLLWGVSGFAQSNQEQIVSGTAQTGLRQYLVLHSSQSGWTVDVFQQQRDGWQDRVLHQEFSNHNQAEQQFKALFMGLQAEPFQAEQNPSELRSNDGEELWHASQSWSWDWELKYAQWVHDSVDIHFYQKYNIPTDCADVAYTLRWIFARMNGLPVANRLGGAGNWFTNRSLRPEWKKLKTADNWYEDQRFLAALEYLMVNTYTHTLVRDSYPIAIRREAFLDGTYHLHLRKVSGHTRIVHHVDFSESAVMPFMTMASNEPRIVRELYESAFWDPDQPKQGDGGFLHMRWPLFTANGVSLVAQEQMPYFSNEEYAEDFIPNPKMGFSQAVMLRLKPDFDPVKGMQVGFSDLQGLLQQRVQIVNEGYKTCAPDKCPEGSQQYEDWSTPSRDGRILDLIENLKTMLFSFPDQATLLFQAWNQELEKPYLNLNGDQFSLKAIIFAWEKKIFSSDPNVQPSRRWGLQATGAVANLTSSLQDQLAKRQKRIASQGSSCIRGCDPNTPGYSRWNTFQMDYDLMQLRSVATGYCGAFSSQQCNTFKDLLDHQFVDAIGRRENLGAWLDDLIWLNSDPRLPESRRWSGYKNELLYLTIPGGSDVRANKAGIILTRANNETQLYSHETHLYLVSSGQLREIAAPSDFHWLSLAADSDRAVAVGGSDLYFYFVRQSRGFQWAPGLGKPEKVMWIDADHILIFFDSSSLAEISLQDQGAKILWQVPSNSSDWNADLKILVNFAPSGTEVMDFSQGSLQKLAVPAMDTNMSHVVQITPKYYICRPAETGGFASDVLLIDRTNGQTHDLTPGKYTVSISPDFHQAVIMSDVLSKSKAELVELNEQLNVTNPKDIGKYAFSLNGKNIELINVWDGDHQKTYYFKNGKFTLFPLLSDEKDVAGISGDLLITRTQSDLNRLRPMNSSKVILQDHGIEFIHHSARWIMAYDRPSSELINFRIIDLMHLERDSILTEGFLPQFYSNVIASTAEIDIDKGVLYSSSTGQQVWFDWKSENQGAVISAKPLATGLEGAFGTMESSGIVAK